MNTPEYSEWIKFIVEHWISFSVGLIGVIGSVASVVSWISSERSKRQYEKLFRYVDLNVDKTITQETVDKIKNEQAEIEVRIKRLKAEIKQGIPIEARRAILRDRHERALEDLSIIHNNLLKIRAEMSRLGSDGDLSDEILNVVRSEIRPKYVLRERLAFQRNIFTSLSGLAGVASVVLPYSVGRASALVLLLFALPSGILVLHLTIAERGGWRNIFRGSRKTA